MTESQVQRGHVYSLERSSENSASDNERIRQWVRSLSEQEVGEDSVFAPEHIYAAGYFHDEFEFTQMDQWEILFYPKALLSELLRKRHVEPELRLFSVVSAYLHNGQELSTQTGFELSFAITEDEEEAIYQRALAAATAWAEKKGVTLDE